MTKKQRSAILVLAQAAAQQRDHDTARRLFASVGISYHVAERAHAN